jgi:N-acetylglucosaminyldiphosphoundecaprenol N-acetyl-beta-D-mannosaminyltransferase
MTTVDLAPARRPSPPWRRTTLMGLGFDAIGESEVIDHIITSIGDGRGGWMVNPNVDVLRQVAASQAIRDLVASADLVVSDGMPIVWASSLQGTPLPERVPGSTLISTLSKAAWRAGVPVFLLGGRRGAAAEGAARLRATCPGLVVGHHCPPFGFEANHADRRAVDLAVESFGPAIYFCGLGFPKQEWLMAELHRRFPGSWFIGSGASLDFLAGETRRAPMWVQRLGLEWAFRLAQEPRRLFRRYVVDDGPFALRMLVQATLRGRSR